MLLLKQKLTKKESETGKPKVKILKECFCTYHVGTVF